MISCDWGNVASRLLSNSLPLPLSFLTTGSAYIGILIPGKQLFHRWMLQTAVISAIYCETIISNSQLVPVRPDAPHPDKLTRFLTKLT